MATNPSLLIVPYRFKEAKLYSQLPESGAGDFDVTRATTALRTNASGFLESVASGVPRLDYPAFGGCPSLLIEPAATNLALRSEEFNDAYWLKQTGGVASAPVVTANAEIAPDGTMNADSVVFNLNGGTLSADFSQITSATITHAAAAHTQSVYARTTDGTNKVFSFVTPSGETFSITITPTWQRFTISSALAGAGGFRLRLRGGEGTASSATIAIWAAQYETGSIATSYIPTVAATVTRNADVISKTAVSGLIGQTQGTIYAELNATNFSDGARILAISNGTVDNSISLQKQSSSRLRAVVTTASGSVVDISTASGLVAGTYKIAFAYALNDFVLYVNGTQIGTDTSGTAPATSRVNLGSGATDANQVNDRISAAAIYTSRLSDTELASLTSL
jgi:hypothetical protein